MATLYSKVERKVWRDEKFRTLSRPEPNARDLWLYMLTCDSQGAFPGLFVLRLSVAAEDLEWGRADVVRMMEEIVALGMAKYDAATSVVWLPNAPRKRGEEALTPNTAKGWRNGWNEIPDCALTRQAWAAAIDAIRAAAEAKDGDATPYVNAFASKPPAWTRAASSQSPASGLEGTEKGLHRGREAEGEEKRKEEKEQEDPSRARARAESALLVAEIRLRQHLFPKVDDRDLDQWAAALRKDPDCHLPADASLVPYLRRALGNLGDLVTADPTKPSKDRFSYVRRTAFGLVNDDKPNGWTSGRTDGREGVCAPTSRPRAVPAGASHAGDFDAANAVREADAQDERLRRERAEQNARKGGDSAIGDLTKKIAAGGRP